jgi:hypothetical protein
MKPCADERYHKLQIDDCYAAEEQQDGDGGREDGEDGQWGRY